ncbi:hypothetical protein P3X46_028961 [Hevea brasiliensis]|uniref:Copper transport protein n=2 Tax=Hevea brasiliensis TaxID=3981 RepID=A0ABQ9KTP0_HEVBR|nr:hypothetical protein P3X46_028961 [Hevea brasiliensis]
MFPGWPGQRFSSYLSVLASVFLVALAIEWLSHARLIKPSTNYVAVGFQQTVMYAIRVALAFLVMLAVMSFNIGVFIAAVTGYSVGFLIFGSQVFKKSKVEPYENLSDLPPLNC